MKIASSGAGSFLEPVSFRVNKPLEVILNVSGRHYSGPKQWFWLLHHQSPWLHFSSGTLSLEISHAPSLHFDKNLINCPHCNIYKTHFPEMTSYNRPMTYVKACATNHQNNISSISIKTDTYSISQQCNFATLYDKTVTRRKADN